VYIDNDMKIFFGAQPQLHINVTRSYKHLGGLQPSISAEIKHRAREHSAAVGPLKKVVFCHQDLDQDSKKIFASALASSKLWYNSATWPRLTDAQHDSLDKSIMKRVAPMTGKQWKTKDVRTSYATICAEVDEPLSRIQLRVSRLEYFSRVNKHAPPQLIALMQATAPSKKAFTSLIKEDLQWLHIHNTQASDACGENPPLRFWSHFASEYVSLWKKYVGIASRNAIRMQNDKMHLDSWARNLDRILPDVGGSIAPSNPTEHNFMCECGEVLESEAAWRRHLSKAHGWRHPTFNYTRGTICKVCGMEFHTRRRLALHWRASRDCFRIIAASTDPLDECEQEQADKLEALQTKHTASFGRGMHFAEKPAYQTEEQLVRFLAHDSEAGIEVEPPGYPHVTRIHVVHDNPPPICQPPTPFGSKLVYVINLFSGQRRVNDVQQQFETLVDGKLNVCLLSVDIINDSKLGNLLNEDTIALWMSLFDARVIIGLACGPPCETFAAIRHCPLDNGKPGPPPLRSLEHLWGLPDLSHKHGIQVSVANRLYRTCILLIAKAKQVGAFGVLEHPDKASWQPLHPSSWLIDQTMRLVNLLHAQTIQIDQCSCGTEYRKPTMLLHVNLPSLPLRIARLPGGGRCTHRKHGKVLCGLDEHGKFRTAPAKEYPEQFCKTIASAMHDFALLYLTPGSFRYEETSSELGTKLAKFYMPLDPYLAAHSSGEVGQDFAINTRKKKTARQLAREAAAELYTVRKPLAPDNNPLFDTQHNASAAEADTIPPLGPRPQGNTSVAILRRSNSCSVPETDLSEAQIDRIASNRRKAHAIRHQKRLLWLQTYTEVRHLVASPDRHFDPVVRAIQTIRSGATLRTRFAFGRILPVDAIASIAAQRNGSLATVSRPAPSHVDAVV